MELSLPVPLEQPGPGQSNGEVEIWEGTVKQEWSGSSCIPVPAPHNSWESQSLGGDIPKDFYPKRRTRLEQRVGCAAGKTPGWAQGCREHPRKRIPREKASSRQAAPQYLAPGAAGKSGISKACQPGNGTKAGALMINSAKSCGFFIPKAPGSSRPM